MGIDFLDGTLDDSQVEVGPDMVRATIEAAPMMATFYVYTNNVWMDPEHKLWLDGDSTMYDEPPEGYDDEMLIVIKLADGYVIDIANVREQFADEATGEIKFAIENAPIYAADGGYHKPIPVVGLICSDYERGRFLGIIETKYGVTLEYPNATAEPS